MHRLIIFMSALLISLVVSQGNSFSNDGLSPLNPPEDPIIVSNGNAAAVQSGPTHTTAFIVKAPYRVTYIMDYHYFNKGERPGNIGLRHEDGTIYGPWNAAGAGGYGNVSNAYWFVRPNAEIKPGRYTVLDSGQSTWSYNSQSKGSGIIEIRGIKIANDNSRSTDVTSLLDEAEKLIKNKEYQKARDIADSIIKKDPTVSEGYRTRATALRLSLIHI